jgi:arylsulfatase A-like enzyme
MARPNVVFVITDDQGYGDLGCHGSDVIRTPNVDRLHAEGVRLTDYHVGPTCAPARAGLMTGRFCNCTGVWHTIGGRSLLRRDETTIADVLRAGGYRTGMFGKWHLGDNYPFRPHDRGFDEALYHRGGGVSQAPDHWRNDYFDDTYMRNGVPEPCEGYCTDVWFREGTRFIERCIDGRPGQLFFCYI